MRPLLPAPVTDRLGQALRRHYRDVSVTEVLGLAGAAAQARGDLAAIDRLSRGGSETETLIRLFRLGLPAARSAVAAAVAPLPVALACEAGLLEVVPGDDDQLRSTVCLQIQPALDGSDGWLLSDFGADVRLGELPAEHVLGVGTAARTLAQATIRTPVARALDIGTGCGVQALQLSRHCAAVTATDLSRRALAFAATTAALNGVDWQLLAGSLLEPVGEQLFDLIVCNPPFVVGPGFDVGAGGFRYRDSGRPGDAVCADLVAGLPARLAIGGTAQLLANWLIGPEEPWQDRLAGWLPEIDCQAWVWQREVAEPAEYVAMWLRDAGGRPGTAGWQARYDRWLDWFVTNRVAGVGMGLITIRRTATGGPSIVAEDVPQAHELPIEPAIEQWFERAAWLAERDPVALLNARFEPAPDLVLQSAALIGADGWQPATTALRQSHGLRWELEVDDAVAALVAASQRRLPLAVLLELVAGAVDAPAQAVLDALLPVVRDLIARGFLVPVTG